MKKLNRRDFLKMGALASGSAVLASCASRPKKPKPPPLNLKPKKWNPKLKKRPKAPKA